MPSTTAMSVGVIGLGRMGSAICERLLARGNEVLAHDVRPDRRDAAVAIGAGWTDSVPELAERCEVVLTVLPSGAEVEAVGAPLLAGLAPGTAWIDMSSATPGTARRLAAVAAGERPVRMVDAPLGGGPADARSGRLLVFAGGSRADLAATSAVFEAVAERVLHVGPHGSGYLTKLLVNLLWFGQAVATAETLAIGARAGLDPHVLRSALAQSAAGGRFLDEPAAALLDGELMPAFSLAGCSRELADVVEIAQAGDVPAAFAELVSDAYAEALRHYGDVDGELLAARLVLERAGLEPPL
jgi:3-hydroxyisobutyrate dehydrogenase